MSKSTLICKYKVFTYVHAHDISPKCSVVIEHRSSDLRNNDTKYVNKACICRNVVIIHVDNEERQDNGVDE